MCERVNQKMPSTTNALEALHGQLNSKIPRRNIFWNAFFRLVQNFIMKNKCINEQIRHNYNNEKKKTISHGFHLQERIKDEIQKYHSSINDCQCSGNRLISCILGVDVPCIHRIYHDASFPECPEVKLEVFPEWDELIAEHFSLEDENSVEQISFEKIDINYITEVIHTNGKFKKRDKIEEFIVPLNQDMKKVEEELYINDILSFTLRIIHIGIEHFNDLKNKK